MVEPLDVLAEILEASPVNRQVFFRNDDGGWADSRLQSLCECFKALEIPLDIAVIPKALTARSIDLLKAVVAADSGQFHLHQHGYAHVNHQKEGRSCEFGSDRELQQQLEDIAQGQYIMQDHFQEKAEPIFTPPWNRCSSATPLALRELGFQLLSRIDGSDSIEDCIAELPVTVDWLKKRKGVPLNQDEIINSICLAFEGNNPFVGIMLHHEQMDQTNREQLANLIAVLKSSRKISFVSMLSIGLSAIHYKKEASAHEPT